MSGSWCKIVNKRGTIREESVGRELIEVGEEKVKDAGLDHIRGDAVVVNESEIEETLI